MNSSNLMPYVISFLLVAIMITLVFWVIADEKVNNRPINMAEPVGFWGMCIALALVAAIIMAMFFTKEWFRTAPKK